MTVSLELRRVMEVTAEHPLPSWKYTPGEELAPGVQAVEAAAAAALIGNDE